MIRKRPKTKAKSLPTLPKVNQMQQAFCMNWVRLKMEYGTTYGIATEAYRLAGYKGNANTAGKQGHMLLKDPKIQACIKRIEEDVNFAAHGNHFGRVLSAAEVLARASRLASASPIDLLNEEGEYDVNYIREHGLEYLCSAVEITTTKYPNGTERTIKKIKVEPRKGFIELLARFHKLVDGDEDGRLKALGRALTGLPDPDYDDILSAVTKIPKHLLQSAPLDGPVPKELLETKETEPGKFEVGK